MKNNIEARFSYGRTTDRQRQVGVKFCLRALAGIYIHKISWDILILRYVLLVVAGHNKEIK